MSINNSVSKCFITILLMVFTTSVFSQLKINNSSFVKKELNLSRSTTIKNHFSFENKKLTNLSAASWWKSIGYGYLLTPPKMKLVIFLITPQLVCFFIHTIKCEEDKISIPEKVDFILAFYMAHEVPGKVLLHFDEKYFRQKWRVSPGGTKIPCFKKRF